MNAINTTERTPENCKIVHVLAPYRFKHYKENSQQFKRGIIGRWQSFNGYGWDNAEAPGRWIEEPDK